MGIQVLSQRSQIKTFVSGGNDFIQIDSRIPEIAGLGSHGIAINCAEAGIVDVENLSEADIVKIKAAITVKAQEVYARYLRDEKVRVALSSIETISVDMQEIE